jgi:hypothetical protein
MGRRAKKDEGGSHPVEASDAVYAAFAGRLRGYATIVARWRR